MARALRRAIEAPHRARRGLAQRSRKRGRHGPPSGGAGGRAPGCASLGRSGAARRPADARRRRRRRASAPSSPRRRICPSRAARRPAMPRCARRSRRSRPASGRGVIVAAERARGRAGAREPDRLARRRQDRRQAPGGRRDHRLLGGDGGGRDRDVAALVRRRARVHGAAGDHRGDLHAAADRGVQRARAWSWPWRSSASRGTCSSSSCACSAGSRCRAHQAPRPDGAAARAVDRLHA